MGSRLTFLLMSGIFWAAGPVAHAQTPYDRTESAACLDYWSVGPSKCNGSETYQTKKAAKAAAAAGEMLPPPTGAAANPNSLLPPAKTEGGFVSSPPKSELDKKVDAFLDSYGKPPREYVEFSMNPTVENAVKWSRKYNETVGRSASIAEAWEQAEKIDKYYREQGKDFLAEKGLSDLPPIPDFRGIPLPDGRTLADAEGQGPASTATLEQAPNNPFSKGIQPPESGRLGAIANRNARLQAALPAAKAGAVEVSYYFSAVCPFCKKMEPDLKRVLDELGNKVSVTCVDMTPGQKTEANIQGKINCTWRPLLPGEQDVFDVKSTPTLVVTRSGGTHEAIGGVITPAQIKAFLNVDAEQTARDASSPAGASAASPFAGEAGRLGAYGAR